MTLDHSRDSFRSSPASTVSERKRDGDIIRHMLALSSLTTVKLAGPIMVDVRSAAGSDHEGGAGNSEAIVAALAPRPLPEEVPLSTPSPLPCWKQRLLDLCFATIIVATIVGWLLLLGSAGIWMIRQLFG